MEVESEKEKPLVTVLNLSFNTGERILNTINSIREQSYANIEHIIIDDGSADNTATIIREWIDANKYPCQLIIHDQNKGICRSINEGLRMAKGKYFALIGDDIMLPD